MDNYDAIVIGAGIAGLGVAGLLQQKGLNTVVLEKSETPGGRAITRERPGGWKVDLGIHCVDLGKISPCANLLRKLGKEISWSQNIQGFLFYDGGTWKPLDRYLDLGPNDIKQLGELEDWIYSASDDEIDRLDNVSLSKLIEQKISSPHIAEFMKIVGMCHATLTDPDCISAGEVVAIYREAIRIRSENASQYDLTRMPLGGVLTMIHAFEEAFRGMGGVVKLGTTVSRISVNTGKQKEVFTDKGVLTAPVVVVAAPIWDMMQFLSMDEMSKFEPEWAERMRRLEKESSAAIGFIIGTKAPLFTEPSYRCAWRVPGVDLPMQLLGHSLFDETIVPPGHMLTIVGACCTPAQAMDKTFQGKIRAAFWNFLKEIFPSIEIDLVWKEDTCYVGIDGLSRSPGMTGRHRPPVHLPGIPGLYFAGDCYIGRGVGMNSAANSAMICANEILARTGHE